MIPRTLRATSLPSTGVRPGVRYSFIKIMTGSDLSNRRLPIMAAVSRRPGPVMWLTACAHGDEVGGVVVVQELFRRLRRKPLLCGELRAFPLMNPLGFELGTRHIAMGGEDLNRSYPGNARGSLANRIAFKIFQQIVETRPAVVLDLHNDWRRSIPYVVLDPLSGTKYREVHKRARGFARNTGLLLVAESSKHPDAQFWHKTLSGSLLRHDVPALTLELGEANVVNETNVNHGVRAVWNIMSKLDMVDPLPEAFEFELPREARRRFLTYSDGALSSSSGIIRFTVKPLDLVSAGQPVAKVYNAFGKLLETVVATQNSLVLGLSDSSVAFPGVPVVALGLM